MGAAKSLWAPVQGDPVFMRRVNGSLTMELGGRNRSASGLSYNRAIESSAWQAPSPGSEIAVQPTVRTSVLSTILLTTLSSSGSRLSASACLCCSTSTRAACHADQCPETTPKAKELTRTQRS